jgi:hypothetical protein
LRWISPEVVLERFQKCCVPEQKNVEEIGKVGCECETKKCEIIKIVKRARLVKPDKG